MPIDVNKYERVRGEFAALLAQFPKNRELARAYDAFCEPSYPRPVIEDAAGETFRKRQRAAEDHFNEFLSALQHAMRAVDDAGAEKICRSVFEWQTEKSKASFQDCFEKFKEDFMPHGIKEQLMAIFDQTLTAVETYKESLVGFSQETAKTVSEREIAYYDEVYAKLTALREQLGAADITDTDRSLKAAEEIRKSLAVLRDKLPSGVLSRLRVNDELGRIGEAFRPGKTSILSLAGKPLDEKHYAISPFVEIGREHSQVVKGVDELEAASFVLGTLRHYDAFLEDIVQKRINLISQRKTGNIREDPMVQAAYQNYKAVLQIAQSVPTTSPQYNFYVTELRKAKKQCETAIEEAIRRAKEISAPDDGASQLLATIQRDFFRVVNFLMSDVFGNYRQRYKRIVENGIYDLNDLYDQLREAVFSNDKNRIINVRAKIKTIIDRLTVTVEPVAVIDIEEPVREDPSLYEEQRVAEEPIMPREELKDEFAGFLGGEPVREPQPEEEPQLPRETAIAEDPSAQHVNVDPVEETGDDLLDSLLRDMENKE